MKKLYVLATALFIGASAQAQTIDFENYLPVAVDTFDNGSALTGDFEFLGGDVTLTSNYNPGGWWDGYSISNMTDITSTGYLNQYSSWTGSGYNSASYAVAYQAGSIDAIPTNVSIQGFKITNGTYAALSMTNGDGYAKEFGTLYYADTMALDGTNGEDYLRVWFYGESHDGSMTDSVEVYLADYRFTDDTQDYILDSWIDVDFSGFGFLVASVTFKFESSDMDGPYLRTPTYFMMDDLIISPDAGISENELANVSTYPNPATDQLTIKGEEGILTITSLTGEVLYSEDHIELSQLDVSNYSNGVYVIKLINASGSYTNRFIKQ